MKLQNLFLVQSINKKIQIIDTFIDGIINGEELSFRMLNSYSVLMIREKHEKEMIIEVLEKIKARHKDELLKLDVQP